MNLYEMLKARKVGWSNDCITNVYAQAFNGVTPTPTEHEYTGAVPHTFTANGEPLIDWYIKGNTVQNGTSTLDNPIMPQGTGERTKNLCLVTQSNSLYIPNYNNYTVSDYTVYATGAALFGFIIPVSPNTTYTCYSVSSKNSVLYRIREYSDLPTMYGNDDPNYIGQIINQNYNSGRSATFTTSNETTYILFAFYVDSQWSPAEITNIMLVQGPTAPTSHIPYGYIIPISCGGTVNNVYIGTNPLRKSLDGTAVDELSSNGTLTQRVDTDGSVLSTPIVSQIDTPIIPTNNGSTTINVDTAVKPSEIYIKWKG